VEDKIKPVPQRANANRHTQRGMAALERSIQDDGWIGAITVAADGETFDGSARVEKTAENGMLDEAIYVRTDGTKPVVIVREDIPTATDPRAIRLGINANRIASLNLEWEPDVLAGIAEMGIDLSTLNFSLDEWADVAQPQVTPGGGGDEFDATPEEGETRTKAGELWSIGGKHRLMVGDCTDANTVSLLLASERPKALILDPPYGMRLDADFSGMRNHLDFASEKGIKNGRKYDNVIGDHEDYDATPIRMMFEDVKEQFWFGADYYSATLGDTMHEGAWLVWDKRETETFDRMYGSCFELIWSAQKHKRDILRHIWAGIFGTEHEPQRGREHPNQKPVRLLEDIIERYTDTDDLVFDGYAGSGTLLMAAHRTGRRAYLCEILPKYADVILRRAEAEGLECVLVDE
jgi:hypothetical protein